MTKTEIQVPTVKISVSVRATNTDLTDFTARLCVYPLTSPDDQVAISPIVGPAPGATSVTIGTNTNLPPGNGLSINLGVSDPAWGISLFQNLGVVTEDQDIVFVLVEKRQIRPVKKAKAKTGR
jgi:hypothetical protein